MVYNGTLFSHRKEGNPAICNNMDEPGEYYAKWNKSNRERQIPHDFTYMWNLKNKRTSIIKQKQSHRYREQTGGCQWGGE